MRKHKLGIITVLIIVFCVLVLLSSCGEYKEDIDDARYWQDELIEAVGGSRTEEFWIVWRWYYNQPKVFELPREPGRSGWACLLGDRSAMIMRRPIEEVRILDVGEECPWLKGDFEVEE